MYVIIYSAQLIGFRSYDETVRSVFRARIMLSYVNYAFLGELRFLALNLRRQLGSDFLPCRVTTPVFQFVRQPPAT